jgi:hypothetical protein
MTAENNYEHIPEEENRRDSLITCGHGGVREDFIQDLNCFHFVRECFGALPLTLHPVHVHGADI